MKKNDFLTWKFWALAAVVNVFLFPACYSPNFGFDKVSADQGEVVAITFSILDTTGCPRLHAVQNSACYDTGFLKLLAIVPVDQLAWDLTFTDNGVFILYAKDPEGVPVVPGQALFKLLVKVNDNAVTGDFSDIVVCDTYLQGAYVCENANGQIQSFDLMYTQPGRVEVHDAISLDGWVEDFRYPGTGIDSVEITSATLFAQYDTLTDESGNFSFSSMLSGNHYITLRRTSPSGERVSVPLVVAINRHIAGIAPLTGFYFLAADVNCDKKIDHLDKTAALFALLNNQLKFDGCPTWIFLPKNFTWSNPAQPFYQNTYIYEWLDPVNEVHFIGIEKGRLPNLLPGKATQTPAYFEILGRSGDEITVGFFLREGVYSAGIQIPFRFPAGKMELVETNDGMLDGVRFGLEDAGKGQAIALWVDDEGREQWLEPGKPLFEAVFRLKPEVDHPEELLELNLDGLFAEVADAEGGSWGLELHDAPASTQISPRNAQPDRQPVHNAMVSPNPFTDFTHIRFVLSQPGEGLLTLTNAGGQIIREQKSWFEAGANTILVERNELPAGVYFYTLRSGKAIFSGKLIAGKTGA